MNETINLAKQESNHNGSEFERLLDEYHYTVPKLSQILNGEIKSIDEDTILLDVGMKRAAIVPSREMRSLSDEVIDRISIGDVIPVYVTRTPVGDEDLYVSIEKGIEHRNWIEAEKLMSQDDAVVLEIVGENRGGLLVQFDHLVGFVPNSQIPELRRTNNRGEMQERKKGMIGTFIPVKPIEVDRCRDKLIFSASQFQKEAREQRLHELSVGDIIQGKVTNIVDYGIFVDLEGIDGLVHISELAWQQVEHPSDLFAVGDEIDVLVKKVDIDRQRISLSRKALIPGPWDKLEDEYQSGDFIEVEIVNIVDFGVFAEVIDGVEGLIHESELGYSRGNSEQIAINPGEKLLVKILSIDPDRRRVALSMRQVPREKQLDWILDQVDDEDHETVVDVTNINLDLTPREVFATYIGSDITGSELLEEGRTKIASRLMVEHGLSQEAAYFAADKILQFAKEEAGNIIT